MPTREEIREGLRNNILIAIKWAIDNGMTDAYLDIHVDEALKELDSQGVGIRGSSLGASHPHLVNYFTFESLIDE